LICIGLAFLGVLLPGLPTTIFLIAASYLFSRSFPVLAERLLHLPIFRPFLPYVQGDKPLPRRARVVALIAMWTAVISSLVLLFLGGRLSGWALALIVGAALIGSYCIATIRR
jgi:uncharacterized membrane protein YbaN (DUF454 family)